MAATLLPSYFRWIFKSEVQMRGGGWIQLRDILESQCSENCRARGLPWASQVVLVVKNLPANAGGMRHRLDPWEEPLEEEMASHSSILAWRIPWTEEPGGLESTGSQKVRHN